MLSHEPPLNPPEEQSSLYIRERIEEICKDILERGDNTLYQEAYDSLHEEAEKRLLEEEEYAYVLYN